MTVHLDPADVSLLHDLRGRRRRKRHAHAAPAALAPPPTFGARAADWITGGVGSWRFILVQSALLVCWLAANVTAWVQAWDPYPFILLNLVLSFQAAYTAPIIMMSQNRASAFDRQRAEDDYSVNLKAELEIEMVHQKIDLMRETEIARLVALVEKLEARLEKLQPG
ncbi:MAG: DUF1003 domain-containing protein [Alphaproteobacteria bacterium]|nr:DUF1003 domain-containing protein [Alphaproteobacteria bacterium]